MIRVFTNEGCNECRKIVELLTAEGAEFTEYDLESCDLDIHIKSAAMGACAENGRELPIIMVSDTVALNKDEFLRFRSNA